MITACIRLPRRLDMLIIFWVIASVAPWLSWVTRQGSVPQSRATPPEEPVIILESQPKVSPRETTNYPALVPRVSS